MDRTSLNTDILIVGAGCAGLSLAVHLLEAGVTDRRIVLVDHRVQFPRDHTWCYWDVADHPFKDCVSHEWKQWRVASEAGEVLCRSNKHPYQHIPADAFYASALSKITQSQNVELRLGEKVLDLRDTQNNVIVQTDKNLLNAEEVFDSRPRTLPASEGRSTEVRLLQHFVGSFIHMSEPVFETDTVTLMDFQPNKREGIHFIYLLPYSRTEALVEATWISHNPLARTNYHEAIKSYLHRMYGNADYHVLGAEWGKIPMYSASMPLRPSRRVYNIGLAGGLARPSTGYAFLAIQRFSAKLAQNIRLKRLPEEVAPWRLRTRFLDRVFLSYLQNHPDAAHAIFLDLFKGVESDRLARFLSDAGNLVDDLKVILAMPKWPMTKEAFSTQWLAWKSM